MKSASVLRYLLLTLLCVSTLAGEDAIRRLQKGDYTYVLLTEPYDLYDSRGKSVKFYREEPDENLTYLLTFVLEDRTGGCLGKRIQRGVFRFEDENLTLYTLYERSGSIKEAPEGAMITRYRIGKNGALQFVSRRFYIESHRRSKHDRSGMRYLFKAPQNAEEKALLKAYVQKQERIFEGEFVMGAAALKLRKKVQEIFAQEDDAAKSVWHRQASFYQ